MALTAPEGDGKKPLRRTRIRQPARETNTEASLPCAPREQSYITGARSLKPAVPVAALARRLGPDPRVPRGRGSPRGGASGLGPAREAWAPRKPRPRRPAPPRGPAPPPRRTCEGARPGR